MAGEIDVSQGRSPRYPRYSLPAAIGYARRLYEGAHRSLMDTDTAYRVMGFSGKTGASSSALGAVRQFGLIEAQKGGVRVSDNGLKILEPSGSGEYAEALQVASGQPTVFSQIISHFASSIPRSDEPIRAYLIRQLEFSKSGADECIASLRETIDFVGQQVGSASNVSLDSRVNEEKVESVAIPAMPQVKVEADDSDMIRIPLTRTCIAQLRLTGEISESAIERLIQHIQLMKDIWAES